MNCNQVRELLPDLAVGINTPAPDQEVDKHIASCNGCAAELRELQQTMALLDEWQAPEPSPYFDTRMQARLREEMARPQTSWLSWLRRPAWAMSLAAALFVGVLGVGIANKSVCRHSKETMSCTPISMCSISCRCRTT
jgi:anti-sigma factor RsiW